MSDNVIELQNVWKIFGDRSLEAMQAIESRGLGKPEVLEEFGCVVGIADCSFSVARGEIFCVMGLSGSGKSTMVRHLNRLIEPTAGKISVLGKDMLSLSSSELREMRARNLGMVFQHMALLPHRTVRDNVGFPLQIRGEPKSKRWEVSQRCLSMVNLDGYEDRFPRELSGGMQQRVGLARALASDPEVLLMDEPFSALDAQTKLVLQNKFAQTISDERITTLLITHDLSEAVSMADRILVMSERPGKIIEEIVVDLPDRDKPMTRQKHSSVSTYVDQLFELLRLGERDVA